MAEPMMYVVTGFFGAFGGGLFYWGFNRMQKFRLINDTPTSKIRSMAMGIVEIHGNVQAGTILKTPFSQSDCVYYKYEIQEYRKHTSRDSKGHTRTYYSWDTVGSGERRVGFYAKDETGNVWVDPNRAEVNIPLKKVFLQKAGIFGAFNVILGALKNFDSGQRMDISRWNLQPLDPKKQFTFATVGDRKYLEYYIEPDENLYLMGTAADDNGTVLIRKGENEPTFIISTKSEKELLKSIRWQMIAGFGLGILFIVIVTFLILNIIGMI
ncbi:MAG: E3 ubiquitin ligase family protein [Nanoarchaeota archaeon]|nr:E3 ubiquitin ligase family protein [Nanoarchaeota archaeon]MBU1703734.1 E3 ubiquitin ligase family protein [Nanoarchaeota archaeon]